MAGLLICCSIAYLMSRQAGSWYVWDRSADIGVEESRYEMITWIAGQAKLDFQLEKAGEDRNAW